MASWTFKGGLHRQLIAYGAIEEVPSRSGKSGQRPMVVSTVQGTAETNQGEGQEGSDRARTRMEDGKPSGPSGKGKHKSGYGGAGTKMQDSLAKASGRRPTKTKREGCLEIDGLASILALAPNYMHSCLRVRPVSCSLSSIPSQEAAGVKKRRKTTAECQKPERREPSKNGCEARIAEKNTQQK